MNVTDSPSIAERVLEIRQRIERAAHGVWDHPISLVAVAKTMPAPAIREAIAAGVDAIGENRVQEIVDKDAQGAYDGAPLHFIGHLQKNKVSKLVGRAELIHSVDSLELARLIDSHAERRDLVQPVLLQVNIAGEPTKSGFDPDAVYSALKSLSPLRHIQICGLMCIPPPIRSNIETQYFVVTRQLYVDIRGKNMDNIRMDFLSMGMSGDFELAVRAGANLLRIGTALFGSRHQ